MDRKFLCYCNFRKRKKHSQELYPSFHHGEFRGFLVCFVLFLWGGAGGYESPHFDKSTVAEFLGAFPTKFFVSVIYYVSTTLTRCYEIRTGAAL